MVNSRAKGASAEREVAAMLAEHIGLTFKRDLEQYRASDHGDLVCDEPFPFVIEVKRYKTGCAAQPAWWDQVCRAAQSVDKWPLLVWRYNRQPWRWRLPAQVLIELGCQQGNQKMRDDATLDWNYAVEMDTHTAMTLIREAMAEHG